MNWFAWFRREAETSPPPRVVRSRPPARRRTPRRELPPEDAELLKDPDWELIEPEATGSFRAGGKGGEAFNPYDTGRFHGHWDRYQR